VQKGRTGQNLPLICQSRIALCELAPLQVKNLPVAGLRRAHPSTSLDKSKQLYEIDKRLKSSS
jgi:hypothetical protein